MKQKLKQKKSFPLPSQESEKYLKGIPESLKPILMPEPSEKETFADLAKALRIREKERNYVMEIQRDYKLSLRPNESLKRTMIRVRLKMLKKKLKAGTKAKIDNFKNLPIDPLE
jgi:hypothetical protein